MLLTVTDQNSQDLTPDAFSLILANKNWAKISKSVDDLKLAERTVESNKKDLEFLEDVLKKEERLLYNSQISLKAAEYSDNEAKIAAANEKVNERQKIVQGLRHDMENLRNPVSKAKAKLQQAAIKATEKIPRVNLDMIVKELEKVESTLDRVHEMFGYESKIRQALKHAGRVVDNDWSLYSHPGNDLMRGFENFLAHFKRCSRDVKDFKANLIEAEEGEDGVLQESQESREAV